MMNFRNRTLQTTCAAFALAGSLAAQGGGATEPTFRDASQGILQRLEASVSELARVQQQIGDEREPLNTRLAELEAELAELTIEHETAVGARQAGALEVANLDTDIKDLEATSNYLRNQITAYLLEFEANLHVTEQARFAEGIEAVKLAAENPELSQGDVFTLQSELFGRTIDHAVEAVGGQIFEGTAVDPDGVVREGAFALIGPTAVFRSDDGSAIGTAEQLINSPQPRVLPFATPELAQGVVEVVGTATGSFPLDATLGNAHKVEATKETFLEHVQKGGAVMWPLFILAGLAALVALWKWLSLSFLRGPSKRQIASLIDAVEEGDDEAALRKARAMKGPMGKMLTRGAEHLGEPRELVEEVMYEKMLESRLELQGMLPFIAICAAAAPLLGLLGTVIGIIDTFKLITVYGSGDPSTLSSGISTALITTEFGLIVAIPALLLHAYLSRKARGIVGGMETGALAFANAVGRSPFARRKTRTETIVEVPQPATVSAPDPELVRTQVSEILHEILGPLEESNGRGRTPTSAAAH